MFLNKSTYSRTVGYAVLNLTFQLVLWVRQYYRTNSVLQSSSHFQCAEVPVLHSKVKVRFKSFKDLKLENKQRENRCTCHLIYLHFWRHCPQPWKMKSIYGFLVIVFLFFFFSFTSCNVSPIHLSVYFTSRVLGFGMWWSFCCPGCFGSHGAEKTIHVTRTA